MAGDGWGMQGRDKKLQGYMKVILYEIGRVLVWGHHVRGGLMEQTWATSCEMLEILEQAYM